MYEISLRHSFYFQPVEISFIINNISFRCQIILHTTVLIPFGKQIMDTEISRDLGLERVSGEYPLLQEPPDFLSISFWIAPVGLPQVRTSSFLHWQLSNKYKFPCSYHFIDRYKYVDCAERLFCLPIFVHVFSSVTLTISELRHIKCDLQGKIFQTYVFPLLLLRVKTLLPHGSKWEQKILERMTKKAREV